MKDKAKRIAYVLIGIVTLPLFLVIGLVCILIGLLATLFVKGSWSDGVWTRD